MQHKGFGNTPLQLLVKGWLIPENRKYYRFKSDDAYLNPTQIGEVVGMSARAVNSWLLNSGLQYKTDDKKIPYRPTDAGKQWGRMVLALAKGSNQTVFQLRWLPTVTELFSERN